MRARNKIKESNSSQTPSRRGGFIDSAWLARDGHKDSGEEYCSRTRVTKNPWWKTVMDVVYNLTLVKIYNRLDRNDHRYDLVGAEVRIGVHEDYSRNQLCGAPITHQQVADSNEENHGIAIRCVRNGSAGIYGSVVSVHIPTGPDEERELSLCEVEVYEEGSSISVNGPRNGSRVGCIVPDVENADISNIGIAKQQVVLAGTSVRITCDAGHDLIGSEFRHVDLRCLDSSSWDKSEPVCEPRMIYRPWGFTQSRCDNGQWDNNGSQDFRCEPKPCEPLENVMNNKSISYSTSQENGKYSHGTVLTVHCNTDYIPAYGNGTVTCNASRWWPVIPTCLHSRNKIKESDSSQTPSRHGGFIDSAWLARDGHKDSGEEYCSRTRVTKNPWWKTVMDVVYNLTLVKIYNRLDRNDHRYDLVGAEVRIGVHEDYSRNQLCGAPITHQQVADSNEENHGIAIRCVRNGSAGIYGSVVSVHIPTGPDEERELSLCEVEVYEEGSSISVNGPRNGSRVGCIVPDVENADISNIGIAKQQFVLAGTSIRISCNAGHTLRGSDDSRHVGLHCLDSSSWDESEPVCEPQSCTVDRLQNGGFPGRKINYTHGENITFACNAGYEKEHDRYWCDKSAAIPRNPRCIPGNV
nr:uncharacterized protein LOC129277387 [Lytechinus pictus]